VSSFNPEDFAQKLKSALEFSETHGRTKGEARIQELQLDAETIAKRISNLYLYTVNSFKPKANRRAPIPQLRKQQLSNAQA
jgi:hypothetical protein